MVMQVVMQPRQWFKKNIFFIFPLDGRIKSSLRARPLNIARSLVYFLFPGHYTIREGNNKSSKGQSKAVHMCTESLSRHVDTLLGPEKHCGGPIDCNPFSGG